MTSDKEVAKNASNFSSRGKDYRLLDLPVYVRWSEEKLDAGESDALIAYLDATDVFLLPEEVDSVTEEDLEEILQDLKSELDSGE